LLQGVQQFCESDVEAMVALYESLTDRVTSLEAVEAQLLERIAALEEISINLFSRIENAATLLGGGACGGTENVRRQLERDVDAQQKTG